MSSIFTRVALAAIAFLLWSAAASAGLTVCNQTKNAVSIAFADVAHHPGEQDPLIANFYGWYGVAAGECRLVREFGGDNRYGEVTNGMVEVENGAMKSRNGAMYIYARDDVGGHWSSATSTTTLRGEAEGHRRDDSGFVWPDTMNICSPSGHGDPNTASVDFMDANTPQCDPDSHRVPYFVINTHFVIDYTINLRNR